MLRVIPELRKQVLEQYLDAFSRNPDKVYVQLFGNFDYSSLSSQAQLVVPGCDLQEGPINEKGEKWLPLYALSDNNRDLIKRIIEVERRFDSDTRKVLGEQGWTKWKLVRFEKAEWNIGNYDEKIELTKHGLTVTYNSKEEPDELKYLRQKLAGSNLEIKVVNQRTDVL